MFRCQCFQKFCYQFNQSLCETPPLPDSESLNSLTTFVLKDTKNADKRLKRIKQATKYLHVSKKSLPFERNAHPNPKNKESALRRANRESRKSLDKLFKVGLMLVFRSIDTFGTPEYTENIFGSTR